MNNNFIEVTRYSGDKIYVNLSLIKFLHPSREMKTGCILYYTDGTDILLRESMEEIKKKILNQE